MQFIKEICHGNSNNIIYFPSLKVLSSIPDIYTCSTACVRPYTYTHVLWHVYAHIHTHKVMNVRCLDEFCLE